MVYDTPGSPLFPPFYANVKDFGAKGDGSTDDASAIQSALDSLSTTGGTIYFPPGVYLIKSAVLFYSNQHLLFDSATLKQGAAINNLLRAYSESTWTAYNGVHDSIIEGAVFDGGTYTENNTLVGISHSKNITFRNCTFKNAYGSWHDLEINSSFNCKVLYCDFEGSRKNNTNGEMIQIDGAAESGDYPWSNVNYDGTVSVGIEIAGCSFHDSSYVPAVGNHHNLAHKFVSIHDCIFDGLTSSRGAINFVSNMTDIDIFDNVFNGCTTGIGSYGSTYYIRNNRFVSATTAISGSTSVAHANMINGTYTA